MDVKSIDSIEQGLPTGTDSDKSVPRRSFRNHVSRFGYSTSFPAKLDGADPAPPEKQPLANKRKRSQSPSQIHNADVDEDQNATTEAAPVTSKRRPAPRKKKESSTASSPASSATPIVTNNLRDSLHPNLTLVMIGLNPGIMTAKFGHPYAHPSNGFWKLLYSSGITLIQHRPQDYSLLPELYGIGNTNICARASRLGSELSRAELNEGAKILDDKIAAFRPEAACITGKGVWEALWSFKTGKKKMPKDGEGAFRYGWQDEKLWLGRIVDANNGDVVWKGAMTFVAPSTSGLNAGMTAAEKEDAWRPIGEWMRKKREGKTVKEGM
jgi:thymine-DNA glycosylase